MGQASTRARLEAIITGDYGAEYPIPVGHFHLKTPDRPLEHADLGTLERSAVLIMPGQREPLIPVDRTAGVGYYAYTIQVQVGYVLTMAGGDAPDMGPGEITGPGTREAVSDRASDDRHKLESAFSSWLNTGALTPHVIDLHPNGLGGLELLSDRAILTVPFLLLTREAL